MLKTRVIITIWLSKILTVLLKVFGKGSGTALPGLLAEKLAPGLLKYLADQIDNVILITGTNGKTTTQTLLSNILIISQRPVVHNKSGSNLKRGLVSSLIRRASLSGTIRENHLIFEIEEATIPKVVEELNPKQIIVTNLYRDQLDAYGEIDRTQKFIKDAISLAPKATVILNADDPRVSTLTEGLPNQTLYYGIDEQFHNQFKYEGHIDSEHLHPNATRALNIKINDDLSSEFDFSNEHYSILNPGVFHIYNAAAAILSAKLLKINNDDIMLALKESKPAFGRGELVKEDGLTYTILLVKNPAGLNLTLNLLKEKHGKALVLMLNDQIADGRDVSWIWDSELETISEMKPSTIICSGIRAEDMLLRVKYALGGLEKVNENTYRNGNTKVYLEKESQNIHNILKNNNETMVYVLPTYTAMLEFRKYLLGYSLNE